MKTLLLFFAIFFSFNGFSQEVHLLMGPSGSGKTYFYETKLKHRIPNYIGLDKIISDLALTTKVTGNPYSELRNQAKDKREELFQKSFAAKESFVYDGTGKNKEFYKELIQRFHKEGLKVILYLIKADKELIYQRIARRDRVVPLKIVEQSFQSYHSFEAIKSLVDEYFVYLSEKNHFSFIESNHLDRIDSLPGS